MRYGVVYRITNLETNKCYIGMTKNVLRKRWYEHCRKKSNCLYLKRAIEKYGKESFSIKEIASSWDRESLKELEMLLIKQENTLVPNGYNLTNLNNGAGEMSEETRQKLRIAQTGKRWFCSEQAKENMRRRPIRINPSHMKSKRFSDEARKNMSIGRTGMKWCTDGINECRIWDGETPPKNFRLGRTKKLDKITRTI